MIRFVFRWAFRLVVLAIVLAVAAVLLKDTVARNLAEQRIRRETGFDAKIGRLELGLLAPTLRLENFTLYNPAEFGGSPIFDISELHLEYDREKFARGKVHLKLLRLGLRELHIVENQQGRTNLVDLLAKVAPETLDASSSKSNRSSTFTGVDMLNLSIEKVRYTNLNRPRRNQEIKLDLRNQLVQNVRKEEDLVAILFKILLRAGITIYLDDAQGAPRKGAI